VKQCQALFHPARARRAGLGALLALPAVAGCGSGTDAQRVFAEAGGRMVEAKAGEVRPCIEVDPGTGCGGFEAAATETVPVRAGATLSVHSGHPATSVSATLQTTRGEVILRQRRVNQAGDEWRFAVPEPLPPVRGGVLRLAIRYREPSRVFVDLRGDARRREEIQAVASRAVFEVNACRAPC